MPRGRSPASGLGVTLGLTPLGPCLIRDLHDGTWRKAEQDARNLLGLIEEGVARNVRKEMSLRGAAEASGRSRAR